MAILLCTLQGHRDVHIAFSLMLLASTLYTLAILSNGWFIVQPTSYYGVWSVTFCDFLQCQEISAIFNDEPDWYHVVQLLNMVGMTSIVLSVIFFLSHVARLPSRLLQYSYGIISFFCILSVISISTGLFIFYSRLIEESPVNHPHISWASGFAGLTCVLQLVVAILLSQNK